MILTDSLPAPGIIETVFPFVIVTLYVIPLLIAAFRRHPYVTHIALINIFLGWTVFGWIVALIWSVQKERQGA